MILFERREAIECQGAHRLLEGIQNGFPYQVPIWLDALERTENLEDLGRSIAESILANQVRTSPPEARPDFNASQKADEQIQAGELKVQNLERRLQIAEGALQGERALTRQAEMETWRWKEKLAEAHRESAQQVALLTKEITELQRIVGEQQAHLNQRSDPTL